MSSIMSKIGHQQIFNDVNQDKSCKLSSNSIIFVNHIINRFIDKHFQSSIFSIDHIKDYFFDIYNNNEVNKRMCFHGDKWIKDNIDIRLEELIINHPNMQDIENKQKIWISGALEYLIAEIYELSIKLTRQQNRILVKDTHIKTTIINDEDLYQILYQFIK